MSCMGLYVVKREASLLFYSSEMLFLEYLNMLLGFEHVSVQPALREP
jgi:hypothetical protein